MGTAVSASFEKPLTLLDLCTITLFTPRHTDEEDRTGSFCHSCFLRSKSGSWDFHKVGNLIPRHQSKRSLTQMWSSIVPERRLLGGVLPDFAFQPLSHWPST